jgi:hypothetical protein
VVATGTGGRALRSVDLGSAHPRPSRLAFSFDEDVRAAGANLTAVGNAPGDPALAAFDASGAPLLVASAFPLVGASGFAGVVAPTGPALRAIRFGSTGSATTELVQLDDLRVSLVPEPTRAQQIGVAALVIAALGGLRGGSRRTC